MNKLRTNLALALAGIIAGGGLPALLYGFGNHSVVNGAIIGAVVTLVIAFVEQADLLERFRKAPFLVTLGLRTAIQIIIITAFTIVITIGLRMIRESLSLDQAYHTPSTQQFLFGGELLFIVLYALTALTLINMIRQMSRMLGQNVLINIIIGKYSKPVEEQRIFMFLDLDDSTTIAERLGNIRNHEFLDDYFYDITKAITNSKGEIYQYVGDEVVVTWQFERGVTNSNCINCFFDICQTMDTLAPQYKTKYGFAPKFKAGFHYGTVVTGEVGDIKKEIVFQGDVVNTAARIKEKCGSLGAKILVSRELLDELSIANSHYTSERVGAFLLKGKEHEVELFSMAKRS